MTSEKYHDNIRRFYAFGPPKSKDVTVKPANWLLELERPPPRKDFDGEVLVKKGFKLLHKTPKPESFFKCKIPIKKKNEPTTDDLLLNLKIEKMKNSYKQIEQEKQNKKIKLLSWEDTPVAETVTNNNKRVVQKCKATNMNNKKCQYKSVCGDFCKRHAPK